MIWFSWLQFIQQQEATTTKTSATTTMTTTTTKNGARVWMVHGSRLHSIQLPAPRKMQWRRHREWKKNYECHRSLFITSFHLVWFAISSSTSPDHHHRLCIEWRVNALGQSTRIQRKLCGKFILYAILYAFETLSNSFFSRWNSSSHRSIYYYILPNVWPNFRIFNANESMPESVYLREFVVHALVIPIDGFIDKLWRMCVCVRCAANSGLLHMHLFHPESGECEKCVWDVYAWVPN